MTTITLLEAIDRAIEGEAEARAFYLDAAEKTEDPGGVAMFRELADFEAHHENRLRALKASLASSGSWIAYEGRELSRTPAAEGRRDAATQGNAGALEALRIAIAAEEKAEAEYLALARSAADPRGEAMFERLASEESLHRKLLNDQYYSLANRGLWVWGD